MKNRTETNSLNGTFTKTFRSVISMDNETAVLKQMAGTALCPRLLAADRQSITTACVQGKTLSEITAENETAAGTYFAATVSWLENFHRHTGIVLEDINLKNFMSDSRTGKITGVDFEQWHMGTAEENYGSLLAVVKNAHFSSQAVADGIYAATAEAVYSINGTDTTKVAAAEKRYDKSIKLRRSTMPLIKQTACVILAGGKSSRMGTDKGLLPIGKYTFTDHIIHSMQMFDSLHLSCNSSAYQKFHLPCITDIYRDCGPLGALHSALVNTDKEWVFILPCDTPFITARTVFGLFADADTARDAIILSGERIYPTIGLYSRKVLPAVVQQLEKKQYSMMALLDRLNVQYVKTDNEKELANINTKAEYMELSIR